jgi:hypothetical protein
VYIRLTYILYRLNQAPFSFSRTAFFFFFLDNWLHSVRPARAQLTKPAIAPMPPHSAELRPELPLLLVLVLAGGVELEGAN